MKAQKAGFLGLVKFFADEWKLQKLVEGCFYCNTPEFYRLSNAEGISDKNESCVISYRSERNDPPVTMDLADISIDDPFAITVHRNDDGDGWMHCWFALYEPQNKFEFESLNDTITRMKKEFGQHIAFIPAQFIEPLYTRLSELTELAIDCNVVSYGDDRSKWGSFYKGLDYAYQSEYRFSVGRCTPNEVSPLILNSTKGFKDLIFPNPTITINSSTGDVRVYPNPALD